jgi:hypothetical protein
MARTNAHRITAMIISAVAVVGCSSGDDQADEVASTVAADGADPSAKLIAIGVRASPTSAPLGAASEITIGVRNDGARSTSVPVTLSITAPSGEQVAFYSTSIFAYVGKETTESVSVTPAQWFAELGRYAITAATEQVSPAATAQIDVTAPAVLVPSFVDVTAAAGVGVTEPAPECGQFSNGAAWGDVDGDGDPDLAVTALGDPLRMFVNDGSGRFEDRSASSGIVVAEANGVSFADYDNDGDDDLLVVGDASDALFDNDGTGHFQDVSVRAGIGDDGQRGMGAAWADFDDDGDLDVYVANYMHCTGDWSTQEEIIAQVAYDTDVLYRNNGNGTFERVTEYLEHDPDDRDDGATIGAGFTAAWLDYNADGRPDLYLANDFVGPSPDHNRLWRNDGPAGDGWVFTDVSLEAGAALFMNTMGIGVADLDNDGDTDLALSNVGGNKRLRNDGGAFVDDPTSGFARPMQDDLHTAVTWGVVPADLNLDGWVDLYLAAGNFQQGPAVPVGVQRNELFVSDDGTTMLDVSAATGADLPDDSKGVAVADYDLDGDLDLFVVNQAGTTTLLQNTTPRGANHWLMVRPIGSTSNRNACGAVVTVAAGAMVQHTVLCGSGGSGSSNQRELHFGLGEWHASVDMTVEWPSGTIQQLLGIGVDQLITVEEQRQ